MAFLKTTSILLLVAAFAYGEGAAAEPGFDEADVYVSDKPGSVPSKIAGVQRFGIHRNRHDDRRGTRRGRRDRVPAPDFHDDPKPLPVFPPLPSPTGPCNIPIVKLAAIKKKCHPKFFFTPWVEVSLFTTCFTRTYFIRWKFCYRKKICNRRVARFRECIFPGMIRCQKTEDLTCPTFVVLKCSRRQPTKLIKPKVH